jgi:thioredoxin-like negative regulator of GroEL
VLDALETDDNERALDRILEAIANASLEERERLRELALAVFHDLGQEDPLTVAYRRRLATVLY